MTTINDIHDLVRIVEAHPEWRSELQRVLLTQELLAMPERLGMLTVVTANLAATGEALLQHAEATNQRLDGIEGSLGSLNTSMNDVRGYTLGGQTGTRLRQRLASTLDLTHPRTLWMAKHYVQPPGRAEAFNKEMEEALDNGKILDAEFNRLQDTDMVMRARDADGRTVYVAIEASGVIGSGDIGRARRSALTLTKMYSENAIPAVYGFSIAEPQTRQAEQTDEEAEVLVYLESETF